MQFGLVEKGTRGVDGADPGGCTSALQGGRTGTVVEHAGHATEGGQTDQQRYRRRQVGQQQADMLALRTVLAGKAP